MLESGIRVHSTNMFKPFLHKGNLGCFMICVINFLPSSCCSESEGGSNNEVEGNHPREDFSELIFQLWIMYLQTCVWEEKKPLIV